MSVLDFSAMRDADWTSLVRAVEHGSCTLMLGPNAVNGTLDGERMPVHIALAHFVKHKLETESDRPEVYEHLDPTRPASVAQVAVNDEDENTLQEWVEEFYATFEGDFDVLRDLAALPFDLVVNSSPGLSAHQVFAEVKPMTYSDFYDRTAPTRATMPDPSIEAPVVYHLYGSLERPASLILSDRDRLDFLVSVVTDNPPLPPKLKSTLCDPNRSFLFLGFDLAQWQFKVLLHVLSRDGQRRNKSFAFELRDEPLDEATQDFYRSDHKIHFITGDLEAFTHELRQRVPVIEVSPGGASGVASDVVPRAATETRANGRPVLPADAPVAFLCHANEDKPWAARLAAELEANGIDAWLDKDDIEGGDSWDAIVRTTIAEHVDYVVVLQSEHLLAKDDGYVNLEIDLALERQRRRRPPRRFVIPVVLDAMTNRLEMLEQWQSIDLTTPTGIDDLVRVIKRDRARERA